MVTLLGKKEVEKEETRIYFVPEFLVVLQNFTNLAKEYGLEVEETLNFHEFFQKHISTRDHFDFFKALKFVKTKGEKGLMEDSEWDCSYLYRTITFRKVTGV